ncbi:hypothetical protein FZC84_07515 [Rossellomorea vietnamensis]|uniref:Uncharacterized protein n=1 Tax=Rossellomorea vietnamensis TaxID=218284 RepID=A0A5D4MER3_9BACI|nr:hypothetical protein [Rossellomorea vietnamensis]TYS00380.1 hypothetical protein FZC84_07515 [Rossellomorea vietnamensis]
MNKLIVKCCVVIILAGILSVMVIYGRDDVDVLERDKVTLVEKYFSPSDSNVAVGIKTKKQITVENKDGAECAMEFSNKKIFEVNCDKYLDFTIGDKVIITYKEDRLIRLGKK